MHAIVGASTRGVRVALLSRLFCSAVVLVVGSALALNMYAQRTELLLRHSRQGTRRHVLVQQGAGSEPLYDMVLESLYKVRDLMYCSTTCV
jgi:hypothetical protein